MSVPSEFRGFAVKGNVIAIEVQVAKVVRDRSSRSWLRADRGPRAFLLALSDNRGDDRACRTAIGRSLWAANARFAVQPS